MTIKKTQHGVGAVGVIVGTDDGIQIGSEPTGESLAFDDIVEFVERYSVFPDEHCAPMLVAWYMLTYVYDRFDISPRVIITADTKGCGKSRVLKVAQHLVARPRWTVKFSPAVLRRLIMNEHRTILLDETDALFPKHGRITRSTEEIRGIINSGYEKGVIHDWCVGPSGLEHGSMFGPIALAGIAGNMPDTITDRAITITMCKPTESQIYEEFDGERAIVRAQAVQAELQRLVESLTIGTHPTTPAGIEGRDKEVWRPLLAIAEAVGGTLPERMRGACLAYSNHLTVTEAGKHDHPVLSAVRDLFGDEDRMSTASILACLADADPDRWTEFDAWDLSSALGAYGVTACQVWIEGANVRGYRVDRGLEAAWSKYL